MQTANPIIQYVREEYNTEPGPDEIERHIREKRPGAAAANALRNWQQDQDDGRTITDFCPNCGNMTVVTREEDRLNMTTCNACYRTICESCHQHIPGDQEDKCLCGDCAGMKTQTV